MQVTTQTLQNRTTTSTDFLYLNAPPLSLSLNKSTNILHAVNYWIRLKSDIIGKSCLYHFCKWATLVNYTSTVLCWSHLSTPQIFLWYSTISLGHLTFNTLITFLLWISWHPNFMTVLTVYKKNESLKSSYNHI